MESVFEVKKSKVMVDLDFFDNFEWYDDPGWGLFQKVDGMRPIKFLGPEIISVPLETLKKGSQQWKYAVESGFDEDKVIVPTEKSIQDCNVPFPFRVQHQSLYPTHEMHWVDDARDYPHSYPVLLPMRPISKGDEVTFNYNIKKKK